MIDSGGVEFRRAHQRDGIIHHSSSRLFPSLLHVPPFRELLMNDHRGRTILLISAVFLTLLLGSFRQALFGGGQFGYRDAGHYYYPLYKRVQAEWNAGQWPPLWEPEENSGMPLLGNPTAAVLYPGKVIYGLLPYPWAARIYVIAHVVLAFGAMLALMRSWGTSWEGSTVSALCYAFGAPVLFQYCNVIYLVGAAWLPLGFLALDQWIRLGNPHALLGLAVVLAMQTLGGDPQSSYLLGLCGGAYAAALAWGRSRAHREELSAPGPEGRRTGRALWIALLVLLGILLWAVGTLALAEHLPTLRPAGKPTPGLPWMRYLPRAVALVWGVAGLLFLSRIRRRKEWSPLGVTLVGLAGSAGLAALLSAAQLLPVLEFTQQTVRAEGEGPHDIYPFSLEPHRLAELLWPGVLGTTIGGNAWWVDAIRFPGVRQKVWGPIYVGGFALVLAAGAFAVRRGTVQGRWMSAIVVLSLLGSLGQYTSPIWAARMLTAAAPGRMPKLDLGPLDANDITPIRQDGYLRDGDGGIYWWMTSVLPGFRQFRFPIKLFTFTALGIAALAGMGLDLAKRGQSRPAHRLAAGLSVLSLVLLGGVIAGRQNIVDAFSTVPGSSTFGPLDPQAGYHELLRALSHGLIVFAAATVLLGQARRSAPAVGALLLIGVAVDLGVANSRYVTTVPQFLLEGESELARILNEAEREAPAPGPFRVHRMPQWNPPYWLSHTSPDRLKDLVEWERATLQPKYGITQGVEYTHTMGVAELYDYEWFFGGFPFTVRGQTAASLGIASGQKVVYFPRRSYNLWGTRYFILPQYPNGWMDEFRAYASFLHETEQIYPPPDMFQGPDKKDALKEWIEKNDFQVRRNLQAYPRAWIVHDARGMPRLEGKTRAERSGPMQEILYDADPIWNDSTLAVHDPRRVVWIDNEERLALRSYLGGQLPRPEENVKVNYPSPEQVELDATLEFPGIVILADVFYPGWELTIDGRPAPIYQVNRLMRGAAVAAGMHRLVYTYNPRSVRVGAVLSIAGLILLAFLSAAWWLRPLPLAAWSGADRGPIG
jgi:hypothetical protein